MAPKILQAKSETSKRGRKRAGSLVYRKTLGWVARLTVDLDGETLQKSFPLETHDRTVARRKLRRMVEADQPEAAAAEASRVETLESYAATWLEHREAIGLRSAKDERHWLKTFWLPVLGAMPLAELGPGDVRSVLVDLAEGKVLGRRGRLAAHSLANLRGVLGRMLGAARQDGLVKENAAALVTLRGLVQAEAVKVRAVLTDDEIRRLLGCPAADPEIKVLVLVSRTIGGMRAGDLRALDWTHFGAGFSTCAVPRRKTRGKRPPQVLDVPETVRPFLDAWHRAHGSPKAGPVFPVRRGKRAGLQKSDGDNWATALRAALLVAGVDRHELHHETADTLPVDFHSTRRAYCTALAGANVATSVAQVLAGHSSPEVHQRYVQAASIRALPDGAMLALPSAEAFSAATLQEFGGVEGAKVGQPSETLGATLGARTPDLRFTKAGCGGPCWPSSENGGPGNAIGQLGPARSSPVCRNSLQELAKRVLHSATHANRYARRYGAELAQAVLGELERANGIAGASPDADAVGGQDGAGTRHWLVAAAELALMTAGEPATVDSLLRFVRGGAC